MKFINLVPFMGLSMVAAFPTTNYNNTLVERQAQGTQTQPYQGGDFYTDSATSVQAVSMYITVPTLTYIEGAAETQAVSFWVGIWGDGCGYESTLLQTGIEGFTYSDGSTSWIAFYETAPDPPTTFNLDVNPGDQLSFQVIATGAYTGKATVDNMSSGQSASSDVTGSHQICTQIAEWVVEDLAVADNLADTTLANFGTVDFTNCLAIDNSGYVNPGDGALVYMIENGDSRVNLGVDNTELTVQFAG